MTAQTIYKSPREINEFLLKIHSKVQRKDFTFYNSRQIAANLLNEITEDILGAEARDMLEHCGLYGYNAEVRYVDLKEGTAGQISLNNTSERSVRINVSSQYKNNGHVLMAILAHEVCHKVLYVNGLYVHAESLNETYVDLATIYMGFGDLILKGYRSRSGGVEHLLGYLKFDVYKVTHYLMCVLFGDKKVDETDMEFTDLMAYDALKLWESKEDKTQILNNILFDLEKGAARTYNYIASLDSILKTCRNDLKQHYQRLHKLTSVSADSNDRIQKTLELYSTVYEYTVNGVESSQLFSPYADKIDNIIEETLFNMHTSGIPGHHDAEKRYPVCPCCGEQIVGINTEDEDALVRCPSCRVRFRYHGRQWTPTSSQRKLVLKQKQEKEYIDEQIRSEVERRLEAERQQAAQETKQKIFKSMPGWLRWLAEDYFE